MKVLEKYIIEKRRFLHQNPEIGFNCSNTERFLESELANLGIDEVYHVGKHSLVAVIRNGLGRVLGLRADFDALEIQEETGLEYSSINNGIMHACGHDAHTAMLLGAAKYLNEYRDSWQGTVKFIFQEAEEGPDPGGAYYIVESKVLDDVEEFFALHVSPGFDEGVLALNYGDALAAADIVSVEFIGKGTHAAYPYLGIDPIVMQADFIMRMQTIVSRMINPFSKAVITIGEVKGGSAFNIIPDRVLLKGTIRTFDNEVRDLIEKELNILTQNIASFYGGECKLKYQRGYDSTINSKDSADRIVNAAKDIFNEVVVLSEASMGAEDFSRYINLKKGAIAWLGVKHNGQINHNIHNAKFNLNEAALIKGTQLFINIVKKG